MKISALKLLFHKSPAPGPAPSTAPLDMHGAMPLLEVVCRVATRAGLVAAAFGYDGRPCFVLSTPEEGGVKPHAVLVQLDRLTSEAQIAEAFRAATDTLRRQLTGEGECTGS